MDVGWLVAGVRSLNLCAVQVYTHFSLFLSLEHEFVKILGQNIRSIMMFGLHIRFIFNKTTLYVCNIYVTFGQE